MESLKWQPSEQEREAIEADWLQVQGACEKLNEGTNDQDEYIRKIFFAIVNRYCS